MATPTSNTAQAFSLALSGLNEIDALIFGSRWGNTWSPTPLTYSFASAQSQWLSPGYTALNEPFSTGVGALSASEQVNARLALATWSNFANVDLAEVADNGAIVGEIRIAYTATSEDEGAHAYGPGGSPASGDIWINSNSSQRGFVPGSFGFYTLLHEIGHALGLKHPFDSSPGNAAILDKRLDQISYTVMAYDPYPEYPGTEYGLSFYPTTPMPLDIQAAEYLYGTRMSRNPDDTTYIFNQGSSYFETIYDTGGIDTIVWSATTQNGDIDLRPYSWSALGNPLRVFGDGGVVYVDDYNVTIYDTTVIENAIGGAANDDMYGNDVANRLEGRSGHDDIFGYDGNDTLIGGEGNDHLYGRAPTGGTDGADSLDGGGGNDYLQGNAGNDTLDGGDGSDRLNGGANDDLIFGGSGNDTTNGNLGNDSLTGGAGNDSLRGGQGSDSLSGGDGDDILSGDLGADTLTGGLGSDIFSILGPTSLSNASDRITDFGTGDRIALGFAPVVLLGSGQASGGAALTAAQQLFDGHAGNNEVAAIQVGADTYLFYAVAGGAAIDSAILVSNVFSSIFDTADFA